MRYRCDILEVDLGDMRPAGEISDVLGNGWEICGNPARAPAARVARFRHRWVARFGGVPPRRHASETRVLAARRRSALKIRDPPPFFCTARRGFTISIPTRGIAMGVI